MNIHFIAIGGAIMHQLAIALLNQGHQITGSDDEINNPAKDNLKQVGLLPAEEGWFPAKISNQLDAIVLGMHAKADNPELLQAQALQIPIYSFPEYIYEVAKDKKRVVIAGSHGKTTTTSMVMHALKYNQLDFDYMVGAKVAGFEQSVQLSDAPIIILEGDEYPASIIEKRPKIHFYQPAISVLTGIAWDHVNVFPTYDNYVEQFEIYLKQFTDTTSLIYCQEDKEVSRVVKAVNPLGKQIAYGTPLFDIVNGMSLITYSDNIYHFGIFGKHNMQNMEAARLVCNELGISNEAFYDAMQHFEGAARRFEKLQTKENFISFRDFAHAPSKLRATLAGAREQFKNYHLIGVFELHTFSSLSAGFLAEYANSMELCDEAAVFYSPHALTLKRLPDLDPEEVKKSFMQDNLSVFNDAVNLRQWIATKIQMADKPVCLLLMSSGTFDGMELTF
jgi:UDP-N-acetylmuramate: L-alanyl-gamma-D-glutamyl-meso-diaminopimelate ligase